ncbi:bacillithiol system redox-active protein YtxJ [Rhodohalobacter sp.]|uniref:bacillithiol system redox-active protein YtxJ n=1 Tax=Rhodohalobacter sp. TaxID=1974210 RepID=UPI002ACE5C1A|nr:bacillithiol system redox-active protein YtxJ [Rhodohalobacter sp.]MDZ7757792.1 bacillithiol system redox-active protein YtxJ [Rhodohalobacter sp.]
MSFLSGLRGMIGGRPQLPEKWKLPETEDDVESLLKPDSGTQVIYKHSYNCAVCIFTKIKVEEVMEKLSEKAAFHFVDVVKNREVSGKIASETGVGHESPQVLVIKNGSVYWHASHSAIDKDQLEEAILI